VIIKILVVENIKVICWVVLGLAVIGCFQDKLIDDLCIDEV